MSSRVYLIHFDEPIGNFDNTRAQARHYIGWARSGLVGERFAMHTRGIGSKLLAFLVAQGIGFEVVRTWPGGVGLEKSLKRRKESPALCPVCNPRRKRNRTRKFRLRFEGCEQRRAALLLRGRSAVRISSVRPSSEPSGSDDGEARVGNRLSRPRT